MTIISSLPSYSELADALEKTKSTFNAAQVHGLLCGLICASAGDFDKGAWQKRILGTKKNRQSVELLQQLQETSYHQMTDFSFEFSLILPEDSIDINARTEALGLWCQGFLTGLDKSAKQIKQHGSEEMQDALNDIIEIAKVNYGDLTDNDEDEAAYFELVEYVRLAALMIFHEMKSIQES